MGSARPAAAKTAGGPTADAAADAAGGRPDQSATRHLPQKQGIYHPGRHDGREADYAVPFADRTGRHTAVAAGHVHARKTVNLSITF